MSWGSFLSLVGFYRKFIPFFAWMLWHALTLCWGRVQSSSGQNSVVIPSGYSNQNKLKCLDCNYPNPNKPFMLFTDASKYRYSGILHQDETTHHPGAEVNFIPIAYVSGLFGRTLQLWNTTQKEYYCCLQVHWKFCFSLSRHTMHTVLWSQITSSILHDWHVQSSAW